MKYVKRVIEPVISKYAQLFPVVSLGGPRQSGKSTTLLNLFKDYQYVTFDDYKSAASFDNDPDGFMERYSNKVIFD